MIDLGSVQPLLADHLAAQRWFDGDGVPDAVRIVDSEQWLDGDPSLWWLLVETDAAAGRRRNQLVVGARRGHDEHDFLRGKDAEILGVLDTEEGVVSVYDATIDAELALAILHRIAPGQPATTVRPLTVEQSNTSIVYDDRVIAKLFRRIHDSPNPDVDVVSRLVEVGFEHVPTQYAIFERDGRHLAVVREFLSGAADGWQLAQTSLRILFADQESVAASGGDFAPEARRLGELTASLHLALDEAYGRSDADVGSWVERFLEQLARVGDNVPRDAVAERYRRVGSIVEAGPAIRIHGDLHLGQTLRADAGWFLLDFEGEPARPVAERTLPSSPLRDVAGVLRSFHYAAEVASAERAEGDDDRALGLADAWESRVRTAFLDGYLGTAGIDALLPDDAVRAVLLGAFELDKAVYEVAYELAYRPAWVGIPRRAITRLLR